MTLQGGWPPSGFGARLARLRESRGWTQRQLAERADCASNTVSELERGEQEPAWPLDLALAKALGVDCTAFTVEALASGQQKGRPRPPKGTPAAPATPQARELRGGARAENRQKRKRSGR
jgi:transcriptional regulator with XRE-family HTH domain